MSTHITKSLKSCQDFNSSSGEAATSSSLSEAKPGFDFGFKCGEAALGFNSGEAALSPRTCKYRIYPASKTKRFTIPIPPHRIIRVYRAGRRTYGEGSAKVVKSQIRKLDKNRYLVKSTGEIREYDHSAEGKNYKNVRAAMQKLRMLIDANFYDRGNNADEVKDERFLNDCAMLTLTYKDNMRDPEKLFVDWKEMIRRLRELYKQYELAYIAVAEPQGRGAWHLHVLMRDKRREKKFWMSQTPVRLLWIDVIKGGGGAHIERIKAHNPADYFTAYFTDTTEGKTSEEKTKNRKKGDRLKFYPKGMRFYRCSQNIDRPDETREALGDVKAKLGTPAREHVENLVRIDEDEKERGSNTFHKYVWEDGKKTEGEINS